MKMEASKVGSNILCEFLEVAIHSILYTRELYPPGVFSRKKKYNVPVQMSSHPELNEYIADVVRSLETMMEEKTISRVDIVILRHDGLPLERFVLEIVHSKDPSKELRDSRCLLQLEQGLRAFLLKLNISDSLLTALPEGCTWNIQVHTKESATLATQQSQLIQDFPWIPAEELSQLMSEPKITPLKSTQSGILKMQLYVEESSLKDNG